MFVLISWSIGRRDWLVLGLVAVTWILVGPVHKLLQVLLVSGYPDLVVLRALAESGGVGITALWIATLIAPRRAANRLDPGHGHGAGNEEHERDGKRKPVTRATLA